MGFLGNLFSHCPEELVGVDIGSSSIKLAHLRKRDGAWDLVGFCAGQLKRGAIVEGFINDPAEVALRLHGLVVQAGVLGASCALSISGSATIVKKLSLPQMTREQMNDSMLYAVEQYIPFSVDDVNVDMQVTRWDAGQGQMDTLMAVAKKDVVNAYVLAAEKAGLKVKIADLSVFAAANAVIANGYVVPDKTTAFINVGANSIHVGILCGSQLVFTRDLDFGSDNLTIEIQKQYNVSFEEAEKFKIIGSDELNRDLQSIAERVADSWITKIQRSLDFFVATHIHEYVQRLLLMGGGCLCPALIRNLERRMECPVEVVNPFRQINVDVNRLDINEQMITAAVAGVAVGLATRAVDDYLLDDSAPGLRINFLPKPLIKKLWHRAIFRSWPAYRGPKRIPRAGRHGKPTDQNSPLKSLLVRLLAIILLLAIVAFGIMAIYELTTWEELKQIQAPAPAPATAPIVKCECVCPGAPPFVTTPKGYTF